MRILGRQVLSVTLLRPPNGGEDQVTFVLKGPTTHPELHKEYPGQYNPNLTVKIRRGYGEDWLTRINVSEYELLTL